MTERYVTPQPKPARRGRAPRKPLPRVHAGGKRSRVPEPLQRYRELEKAADKLWSFLVRFGDPTLSGRCDCGCYRPGSDAHHIFSRSFRTTRWLLYNGLHLARGCHRRIGSDHSENRALAIKAIGQAEYDRLDMLAHCGGKVDPALAAVVLKQEIKDRGLEAQARERGLL